MCIMLLPVCNVVTSSVDGMLNLGVTWLCLFVFVDIDLFISLQVSPLFQVFVSIF